MSYNVSGMSTTTDRPTFRSWLREELTQREMSVRALARGIDPGDPDRGRRNLHRWLSGQTAPTTASRDSVADALGVPREQVPSDDDEESDPVAALLSKVHELALLAADLRAERAAAVG